MISANYPQQLWRQSSKKGKCWRGSLVCSQPCFLLLLLCAFVSLLFKMPRRIAKLQKEVVNRIAAGEVRTIQFQLIQVLRLYDLIFFWLLLFFLTVVCCFCFCCQCCLHWESLFCFCFGFGLGCSVWFGAVGDSASSKCHQRDAGECLGREINKRNRGD